MRARWWWTAPALAAALLVGPVACAGSVRAPRDASVAPSVLVGGRAVPYDGPQRWSEASTGSRSATTVTVFATGYEPAQHPAGGPCGPPVLRFHAEETARTIAVRVDGYQEPIGATRACPAIGYLPSPHVVRLARPIGDRRVVDATSGKAGRLLVGTDYPDLPESPVPGTAAVLRTFPDSDVVQRMWGNGDGRSVRLEVERPSDARDSFSEGRIVQRVMIGRSVATVIEAGGQHVVQWTPNDQQAITLYLGNGTGKPWNAADAVHLARSVTGYRSEDTRRLPQPLAPGTAAAFYSSADGPVRHAELLLKSSRVHVALDCVGAGRVDVTVRGTTYPFRCAAEGTHVVRTSTGPPDEAFLLDVAASGDVRWALTLARGSTDGS